MAPIPAPYTVGAGSPMDSTSQTFSKTARDTLIATAAVGGTLIFALILYIIYLRRKGTTYAQILHVQAKSPVTPQLTPTPMRETFLKHPIYHDIHYSVRSSRHCSTASWPPRTRMNARMNTKAADGQSKHKRIQSGWKDLDAPATPTKDPNCPTNSSTFFLPETPKLAPRIPEKAHISVQISHKTSTKAPSVAETYISTNAATLSPLTSPPLFDDSDTRWSWTNSQAPSTPRLRPDSRRTSYASKHSPPRFRSVVSWARGQGECIVIDEEAPPLLPVPPPVLTLQSVPENKRAFKDAAPPNLSGKKPKKTKGASKGHQKAASSVGGLGAFFRHTSNSKSTNDLGESSSTASFFKLSSKSKSANNLAATLNTLESGQDANDIELKERQK